jgi:hypothetical protein
MGSISVICNGLPKTVIYNKYYIILRYNTTFLSWDTGNITDSKPQNLKIEHIKRPRIHFPFCSKVEDREGNKPLHMTDYKASYICLNYVCLWYQSPLTPRFSSFQDLCIRFIHNLLRLPEVALAQQKPCAYTAICSLFVCTPIPSLSVLRNGSVF